MPTPEEFWEDGPQGIGNTQHHLREATGQHAQQVLVLGLILVHGAIVVVEASLEQCRHGRHSEGGVWCCVEPLAASCNSLMT